MSSSSVPPANLVGRTIGDYEITASLGAGGMGVVYRARDRKLGRDVAIKVLPDDVALDAERLSRFRYEARLLATVSHPNIGAIYGIVEDGPTCALALELLEGETVDSLVTKGPLRPARALAIAIEIAEALDHVHRRGVTHRDLKPSNILITRTGAKLLDFGIGKWSGASGIDRPIGLTTQTAEGVVVGTLNYMSPEQLEGREIGPRSDLFSFGAVLYEMITGIRAFSGPSSASVVAAIIHTDPAPMSNVITTPLPARLDRVTAKCLEKDPDRRWQTARDLADELRWTADELRGGSALEARPGARAVSPIAAAGIAAAAVLAGGAAWSWLARPASTAETNMPPPVRFVIAPPVDVPIAPLDFDISRDGRVLAFRGAGRLFIRRLDAVETTIVPAPPLFSLALSPDGESIAFFSKQSLYRLSLRGDTPPAPLAAIGGNTMLLDWPNQDTLLYSEREQPMKRVSAGGGPPRDITPITAPLEVDHHSPSLLPDGKTLLFAIHHPRNRFSVALMRLDSGERVVLVENGFEPSYLRSGHLVFGRGSALLAAPFDAETLRVTGPPVTVLEGLQADVSSGDLAYRVSDNGTLVYQAAIATPARRLVWVDRAGRELPVPIAPVAFEAPRVSPDGKRIAFGIYDERCASRRVWIYDVASEAMTPLTLDGNSWGPAWTRDGSALVYGTDRTDASNLLLDTLDGKAPASIGASVNDLWPAGFADDGSIILVEDPPTDKYFLSRLKSGPQAAPQPLAHRSGYPNQARVSPDGHWLAYQADDDSERLQVFVEPASGLGPRRQVSVDGGRFPVWSRDGRELFFRRARQMVAVTFQADGFTSSKPRVLFEGDAATGNDYDVAPDGRFLMMKSITVPAGLTRLHVVLNWATELLRRVPRP